MNTRRDFIRQMAVAGVFLATGGEVFPKERSGNQVRFTKLVRKRTRNLRVKPGRWKWLVVHHSGIAFGNAASYDRQHRQRGMENGLAYHFVIGNGIDSGDGKIEIGSRWLRQLKGGHVAREEINEVGIGICLVGNFEKTRPTKNQMVALRELVDYLRSEVVGNQIRFAVHSEIDRNHTACPGRHFPAAEMHRRYG